MSKLRVLDLFSGIGGFSLGLERTGGFEAVAFCEIEPYCRAVLAKHWPGVPCYDDVRELTASRLAADGIAVDVICGGFPCQDISAAGLGAGLAGSRSGLWAEFARLIRELRPRFIIVENVSALLGRGVGTVLGDLATLGFDAEWHCIPAGAVGAGHIRDRVWIVGFLPDAASDWFLQRWWQQFTAIGDQARYMDQWTGEPEPPRVADGVSNRMDTIRATGNAVVPQIPELIGYAILKAQKSEVTLPDLENVE